MHINLIDNDEVEARSKVAIITNRQLAAFRSFAKAHEQRRGDVIIDPAGRCFAVYAFEARVCPIALAALARLFDFDLDMISVIDEAQFLGRLIRFERDAKDGTLRARVSETEDDSMDLRPSRTRSSAHAEA